MSATANQGDLFQGLEAPVRLPLFQHATVLITVKTAPTPSATYGETVRVAGLRLDPESVGWVRLYPINYRSLEENTVFSKYAVVGLKMKPADSKDSRQESWRPDVTTIQVQQILQPWAPRQPLVEPYIEDDMCGLIAATRVDPGARSLGLIRPVDIAGFDIEGHPSWTEEQQAKLDRYAQQPDLFDNRQRTQLEAPRFLIRYRYRCSAKTCSGHVQQNLDWEFVRFQRRLGGVPDDEARRQLEDRFFRRMTTSNRDTAFFVGNQAARRHIWSILGVWYPKIRG